MTNQWLQRTGATQLEVHFCERVVGVYPNRLGSFYEMLLSAVRRFPDGEAYVVGERRLTWTDFHARVTALSCGLANAGLRPGERIAALLSNRLEFIELMFASARLGAIFVPLSARAQRPEIAYMLVQCEATAIVHDAALSDRLPDGADLPGLRLRFAIDGTCAGSLSFDALLDDSHPAVDPAPVGEDDPAVILYTSGTTGRPKGAVLAFVNAVHAAIHVQRCVSLDHNDRCVVASPLNHVTGVVSTISVMMNCGGTLILLPTFKAPQFLEVAERERMSVTIMVPSLYNLLLLQPSFDDYDLTAWTAGVFGGSPMAVDAIARLSVRLPQLRLMNTYGATEASGVATLMPPELTAAHRDSAGYVLPAASVIVMRDDGRECAAGEVGELWIAGGGVVQGYWNDPVATRESFVSGYWRSGDLGSIDAGGLIRVVDRKKDMIIRGGLKVFTIEVENVLLDHPAVTEAAAVAKPCPVLGERVHAFVTVADEVAAEALAAFCRERLSDYKVPEAFTILTSSLPRNANGKVMKHALRAEVAAQVADAR